MASIGQGRSRIEQQAGRNQAAVSSAASQENTRIQRGFSNQNTYSRTEGSDAVKPQVHAPVLDRPAPDAESGRGVEDFLRQLGGDNEPSVQQELSEGLKNLQQNPLGKQIKQLQGKQGQLEELGFNKSQIDALSSLANPDDPDNALASMHSVSARVADMDANGGDARLNGVLKAFEDVTVRMSSLTHIPKDLQAALVADIDKFTKAALNPNQPLDIDSATTMLVEIQSKLQNERLKFDQENIKIGQIAAEQRSSNIIHKIKDSIEKAKEAEKSGLIGKIFGYIALAFMAIATAVVAVVGILFTGGVLTVVAVSLMVAAMALMVVMIVSSETDNFMMKIFDGLASDDEGKQKARIGAMVFWAAIMIALTLGAAAAGGFAGAGGAAASTASAATTTAASGASVAASGANTAATAASTASKITAVITKLAKLAQLIGGVSQVASGGADIATSTYTYQADIFRAEALEEKAEMARIQQAIDDAMEAIEKAIDELQSGYASLTNIIKANHDTKTTLARNLRA